MAEKILISKWQKKCLRLSGKEIPTEMVVVEEEKNERRSWFCRQNKKL